jgi:hypothetical protein
MAVFPGVSVGGSLPWILHRKEPINKDRFPLGETSGKEMNRETNHFNLKNT